MKTECTAGQLELHGLGRHAVGDNLMVARSIQAVASRGVLHHTGALDCSRCRLGSISTAPLVSSWNIPMPSILILESGLALGRHGELPVPFWRLSFRIQTEGRRPVGSCAGWAVCFSVRPAFIATAAKEPQVP
jgi:hypothetical protein